MHTKRSSNSGRIRMRSEAAVGGTPMARSASPASSIATASSRAVKLRMRRVMAGAASRRRSTSRGRKEGRVLRQTEGDSRGRGAGAEGLGELKRALDVRERAAEEFGEVQRARRRLQARRAALIAGWVRPMRAPARVTLRSAMRASKATSRLRSMPCKSMRWMAAHNVNRL